MAVYSSEAKAGPFIADGSQREFPYRFKVLDPSHIQVYINGAAVDGGYTVNESSVMMDVAPPAGANVVLLREVPLTQEVDIQNNTAFYPEVLEGAYDKLTMITQQLAEQVERSIKVGVGETDASPDALLNNIYASGNAAVKAGEAAVKASAEAVEASQTAKDTAEEITKYFGKTTGLPVGFTFASPSAMPPEGAYLLNGQTIACGEELYQRFYVWVTTSPVRRITADEYEAEIAEYGICNGFVVSGTSVRLPLWKGYQTPLGDSVPVVGNGMTLGFICYNGKTAGAVTDTENSIVPVEAAYGTGAGLPHPGSGASPAGYTVGITADPYKSGIIADTSGYPQDGFHWCIQVYNAATALSEQESAQLASEMQLKAQTDLGNVTNPTQGFKDMAVGWGMPDYSAGIDVSANFTDYSGSYTAPARGVLLLCIITRDYTVSVSLNGGPLLASGGSYSQAHSSTLYVEKGDVLSADNPFTGTGYLNAATFYPLKGANK